jgi:hypothetical protein
MFHAARSLLSKTHLALDYYIVKLISIFVDQKSAVGLFDK